MEARRWRQVREFGELEMAIMDVMWAADDPCMVREVRERLVECRHVPRWRQVDARAWWQQHGELVRPDDAVHSEITRTLAVDPGQMR